MTQTAVTVGCNVQFPREAAMQSDQMTREKINIQKAWHQVDKPRARCCEAQEACLSPKGTAFARLYRLQAFHF